MIQRAFFALGALVILISVILNMDASGASGAVTAQSGGMWSPYLVGSLIGLLVCLTFYVSSEAVGASSFYASLAGLIGRVVAPKHTAKLSYFREKPAKVDWEFMFVLAIVLGSGLAALTGGEFAIHGQPQMWIERSGENSWFSYIGLGLLGGAMMAFGARLAGGCTSGHGISGASQLSVSSWISLICFFIGGVLAVRLIY